MTENVTHIEDISKIGSKIDEGNSQTCVRQAISNMVYKFLEEI